MREGGIIYIFSLLITIFLAVVGSAALLGSLTAYNVSVRYSSFSAAFHLAESAADYAIGNLRFGDMEPVNGSFPGGTFWAFIESMNPGYYEITAHGLSESEQRALEVVVRLTPQSVFKFPIFGEEDIDISGSMLTDSYDSRQGRYDSQTPGNEGNVGTNSIVPGGISISGSAGINGQVIVGPTSDPEWVVIVSGGAVITGDPQVVAQSDELPMLVVAVPDGLTCEDLMVSGNSTVTLSSATGTYCYQDLTVQGGGALTADGSVVVYLTGVLNARGNSVVGVENDPTQMIFLMTSTNEAILEEGTITGSTEFYGGLYGPNATITISGNADVYGSVMAENINVTGSAEIHYDEALADIDILTNSYNASVISWQEL